MKASRVIVPALIAAAMGVYSVDAGAQSLGDVARKEAERRGSAPAAGKTYTNENLTPDFTTPAAPAEVAPAQSDAAKPAGASADTDAAKQAEAEEAAKWGVTPRDQQEPVPADELNEEFWRSRATLIKARLANQNAQVLQLRQHLAALPAGGDERAVAERTMDKAVANLDHLNAEWARFEKQARDRKVPERWYR
jgi:hypothetical protein